MSGTSRIELDFPLCAEEAAGEAARPAVFEAVRFLQQEAGPGGLEAVILTGSFSRGEGSLLLEGSLRRVLGDIEFLVIARTPFDFPKLRRDMRQLGERATKRLRGLGYDASIEYSPAGRSYLQRAIRPSIFAFDLLSHGKTLSGDPELLAGVHRFGASAIPAEDAVRLVMNRMMEIHALRLASDLDPVADAYHRVKTTLDLAGSALAFEGRYASRYAERLATVRGLSRPGPFPEDFEEELGRAISLKLRPSEEALRRTAPPLEESLDLAMEVWKWEMEKLVGGKDVRELLEAFLASEGLWQTMRGWLKYYTHPLRPVTESAPLWRRVRLWMRASPQRLAYASALLAYLGERSGAGLREEAARLLPSARAEAPLPGAIELWSWLVRNN